MQIAYLPANHKRNIVKLQLRYTLPHAGIPQCRSISLSACFAGEVWSHVHAHLFLDERLLSSTDNGQVRCTGMGIVKSPNRHVLNTSVHHLQSAAFLWSEHSEAVSTVLLTSS